MKNILYEGYLGPRLPREVQLKRVQRVMQEELTPLQRETLIAFYFQGLPKSIAIILCKSPLVVR